MGGRILTPHRFRSSGNTLIVGDVITCKFLNSKIITYVFDDKYKSASTTWVSDRRVVEIRNLIDPNGVQIRVVRMDQTSDRLFIPITEFKGLNIYEERSK